MVEVRDLRKSIGYTQQEFADYFEIPIRTVVNWEQHRTSPPDYLVKLFEYKLKKEGLLH